MPIKKAPLFIINVIVAISLVITLAFLTNQFLEMESSKEEELVKQDNIKKQLLILQKKEKEYQKVEKEKSKVFEVKTKSMEIESSQETIMDNQIVKTKDEKSIFHYIDDEILVHVEKNESVYTNDAPAKIIKILPIQIKPKKTRVKPKLAIIIDDVVSSSQVSKVNRIPYPVTMAFLPPTSRHKNSAKITKNVVTYMIHLPLEASTKKYEEANTLHVGDDISIIRKRIDILKKLYPKAKYINNHTGSKFTKNAQSMNKLLKVLKEYNYIFIDSKTTTKTATKQYATKYNLKYFTRDIFLDNKRDKKYIQKQIQKVVKIAKRDGYAIAIGHPHSITLKTLAQSKHLLEGLDIVLINKL